MPEGIYRWGKVVFCIKTGLSRTFKPNRVPTAMVRSAVKYTKTPETGCFSLNGCLWGSVDYGQELAME
jgi:hypothetical protein